MSPGVIYGLNVELCRISNSSWRRLGLRVGLAIPSPDSSRSS